MLHFTLLVLFLLGIAFDIFNITFHFCFLKSKFWGCFPSKKSFWLSCTSHENAITMSDCPPQILFISPMFSGYVAGLLQNPTYLKKAGQASIKLNLSWITRVYFRNWGQHPEDTKKGTSSLKKVKKDTLNWTSPMLIASL